MSKIGFLAANIFIAALSACTTQNVNIPEPDYDAVRTQAVQTAVMQITADAVLHPGPTPTPQLTALMAAPGTPVPAAAESGMGQGNTGQDDITLTGLNANAYACSVEESFQSPPDGPRRAGETFTKVWHIRNTGSASWRSGQVAAEWVGGTHLCDRDRIELARNVAVGDSVDIRVPVKVPETPSDIPLMMAWALVDGDGQIFCKFYHVISAVN